MSEYPWWAIGLLAMAFLLWPTSRPEPEKPQSEPAQPSVLQNLNLTDLSTDIARRVPEMARDGALNNQELIASLIRAAIEEAEKK